MAKRTINRGTLNSRLLLGLSSYRGKLLKQHVTHVDLETFQKTDHRTYANYHNALVALIQGCPPGDIDLLTRQLEKLRDGMDLDESTEIVITDNKRKAENGSSNQPATAARKYKKRARIAYNSHRSKAQLNEKKQRRIERDVAQFQPGKRAEVLPNEVDPEDVKRNGLDRLPDYAPVTIEAVDLCPGTIGSGDSESQRDKLVARVKFDRGDLTAAQCARLTRIATAWDIEEDVVLPPPDIPTGFALQVGDRASVWRKLGWYDVQVTGMTVAADGNTSVEVHACGKPSFYSLALLPLATRPSTSC